MSASVRLALEPAAPGAPAGTYARLHVYDDRGASLGDERDFAFAVGPDDRSLLRWASLEFAAWPFGGYVERARRAADTAAAVGAALYRVALAPFVARAPSRIVVQTSLAEAMRLPWELLHDGAAFVALGAPGSAIARTSGHVAPDDGTTPRDARGPLRVLIVTARPDDAAAVDSRIVARALYRRLEARVRDGSIVVENLQPPTAAALDARLRAGPPVDVVHFDGHGTAHALDGTPIEPSLVFETDRHRSELVPAATFARTLADGGVRAAILTACETASVVDASTASAAATIVAGGVGAVVAMGDEILVETAAAYADAFYQALAAGATVANAHANAARMLAGRPAFAADWWTPQLYVADPATLDSGDAPGVGGAIPSAADGAGDAFVGRSAEFVTADRAAFERRPIVLRGFAGAGKTALANEIAGWLETTGACASRRNVRCADDPHAVRAALEAAGADAGGNVPGAPRPLLVVDALDAAGDGASVAAALAQLATRAVTLVTTRDVRDASPALAALPNAVVVTLGPLAVTDGITLARHAFAAGGVAADALDRSALETRIVAAGSLPGGILAQAAAETPAGAAPIPVERALAAWGATLEASVAALGEEDRRFVERLAPFVRGASYFIARTHLGLERERFGAFVEALQRTGLGSPVALTHLPEGNLLCLRLHPALTASVRARVDDRDEALRFARAYDDLSATLAGDSDSADPYVQARLYDFERPNLERAVDVYDGAGLAAEAAALRASLDALAGRFGGHLDEFSIAPRSFPRAEEDLLVARDALASAEARGDADPLPVENARVVVGIALDRAGRTSDAADETRRACETLAPLAQRDGEHALAYANALHMLGGLQRKLGRNADARDSLLTAVPIAEKGDRTGALAMHLELGDLARALGVPDDARNEYGRALVLARLLRAVAEEAGAQFGLGSVAYAAGDLAEAERCTREAARLCESFGDVRRVTSAYLTLGSIAVDRGDGPEADRWFAALAASPGYAACDAATKAFFDVSISAETVRLVSSHMGREPALATATTPQAWRAGADAFFAADAAARGRIASAKALAQRVADDCGRDPGSVPGRMALHELGRITWMETGERPA